MLTGAISKDFRIHGKNFPSKEIFDPPQPLGCPKLVK
jgi:hypothetical protein